ncbi:uncharacterized protein K452DRAFT_282506 [Aplosporella prunicola CBS 121167]|uniref:Developmental regulator protein n=1 Tax=Aplosporella prunicola CBS 121167 TaxID=1176127 RepID=A0A6A6BUK1_9PEZI|nr:uncharacterized protein K452DRAFT_282506 [Aplosporella prunicola CBS 121167]KAF2147498.1 hypothetical protein K452DRAFT_282506 [Aplosporella prunicola CBS 121167]
MPTYLLHGFRWPRHLIRIHIILQNLEDAAAEWLMAPATTACMRENLETLHPQLLEALPNLQFVEQYDTELAESMPGGNVQPFAYVADVVEEVKLGVEVGEVMGRGVGNEAWAALTELRDQIAPGERVAWFVVVCQDVERLAPPPPDEEEEDEEYEEECEENLADGEPQEAERVPVEVENKMNGLKLANGNGTEEEQKKEVEKQQEKEKEHPPSTNFSHSGKSESQSSAPQNESDERPSTSRSVKRFFSGLGGLRKAKSMRDLRRLEAEKAKEMANPPPLPGTAV